MLAVATHWLAARSDRTFLAARRASSFVTSSGLVAIDADWNDGSFEQEIGAALQASKPIEAALLWLHEPEVILPWLLPMLSSARVVLLLGSTDGQAKNPGAAAQVTTVRLGSARTEYGRRWLTHGEISTAAIASLEDGRSRVVGEFAPMT